MTIDTIQDPKSVLETRFVDAIRAALPDLEGEVDPLIGASRQPELGDFQSNAAMPLAKRVGMKPRDVAVAIVEKLDVSGIANPVTAESIAGPGFINISLLPEAIGSALSAMDDEDLGLPKSADPETIVVDLCGVNLAKQMHVGHLRSSVIGDAIARLKERLGHTVIRQSHVGDWGLPIAMVVQRLIEMEDAGVVDTGTISLDELNTIYRAAQAQCKAEKKALALIERVGGHAKAEAELGARIEDAERSFKAAQERLVKLQSGDERSVAMWNRVYEITMGACLATCAALMTNITDEHSAGESTYRDELGPLIADLESRGIAEIDDGALVVKVEGIKEPTLVRKRNGGYLYATTDMAAIRRRVQKLGADQVIYCVDARQALHFKQVFGAAIKAGYATKPDGTTAHLEHAAFGNVLGEDNKPLKTRSGENVKLQDLLDEAVVRAKKEVDTRSAELPNEERATIANHIAIAAIKYADLSTERVKDYVFSFERMLAFEGDTGPYILYAVARINNLVRKAREGGVDVEGALSAEMSLDDPAERALALLVLRYPAMVRGAAAHDEPNRLCGYLYDLASMFAKFYEKCPILKEGVDGRSRDTRLRLAVLTKRVLEDGCAALGIPVVDRM
jgi:arginyl-tRNA synthetase